MEKTTVICDACCDEMKSVFVQVEFLQLCERCCKRALREVMESRDKAGKKWQSHCSQCDGTGKVRVKDEYASDAQASCGENRIQYKTVRCEKCKF